MAQIEMRGRYQISNQELPMVCAQCGARAVDEVRKKFTWQPSWVAILILAGLIPYVIVSMLLTKTMTVHLPTCRQHRRPWFWVNLFVWVMLTVFFIGGAGLCGMASSAQPRGPAERLVIVFVVVWLALVLISLTLYLIAQWRSIRAMEITDTSILLTNVSEELASAYYDEPRRRRVRDELDDDDDDRRRDERVRGRHSPRPRYNDDDDDFNIRRSSRDE